MAEKYDIIAATGCPTGIAHTFMAKEALEKAAAERGLTIKVETHGQVGIENALTPAEIAAARAVVVAADKDVNAERFAGKPMVSVGVSRAISQEAAGKLIDDALAAKADPNAVAEPASAEADSVKPQQAVEAKADEAEAAGDFVKASNVFCDQKVDGRDAALKFISDNAVAAGIADDADALLAAFLKREEEGTTGMVDGFAIPHAKTDAVKQASVMVLKAPEGVPGWDTMDEAPVTCAIALLVPEAEAGTSHLQILSKVAMALTDDDFRAACKDATDPAAVASLINERLV